jgi:hypothetical protein
VNSTDTLAYPIILRGVRTIADPVSARLFIDRLSVSDEDDNLMVGRPRCCGDTLAVTVQHFQDAPCLILKRRDSGNRVF